MDNGGFDDGMTLEWATRLMSLALRKLVLLSLLIAAGVGRLDLEFPAL